MGMIYLTVCVPMATHTTTNQMAPVFEATTFEHLSVFLFFNSGAYQTINTDWRIKKQSLILKLPNWSMV